MNGFNRFFVATLLSAAMLFSGTAQAMLIQQFDKMDGRDQDVYVGDLVVGAEKVLTDSGRPDLALQVKKLFTTKEADEKDTIGMVEFEINLARLHDMVKRNPNASRLEVEHAMILTLKDHNIILPPSFMHVASGFQPKFPPQQSKDTAKKDTKKN